MLKSPGRFRPTSHAGTQQRDDALLFRKLIIRALQPMFFPRHACGIVQAIDDGNFTPSSSTARDAAGGSPGVTRGVDLRKLTARRACAGGLPSPRPAMRWHPSSKNSRFRRFERRTPIDRGLSLPRPTVIAADVVPRASAPTSCRARASRTEPVREKPGASRPTRRGTARPRSMMSHDSPAILDPALHPTRAALGLVCALAQGRSRMGML